MNIYSRHEFQADSRFLYQVCEYVPGCTLRQWLYDNPNPNLTQARALLINIIQAVRALQRQGMLHRDLKPENIMVFDDNRVKLIDLGSVQVSGLEEIASVVDQSRLEGAVGYIAPEYLLAQRGTHQSDIFSIGCIFYEILTGQLPFATPLILKSRVQSLAHWRYRSIRQFRDDLPPWLDAALEKATNPNRAKRYQAMSEMLADVTTPNTSLPHSSKSAPLIERNPVAFWQLVSGLLALGLIVQNLV